MMINDLKDWEILQEELYQSPFDTLTARRYRGAIVEVFKKGIHTAGVKHVDVSSMYPNIMIVFNLSPEAIRIAKLKPLTGQYIFTPTYIEIPDETLRLQLCLEIDEEDSISRNLLTDFYNRRTEYKKLMTPEEKKRETGPNFAKQLTLKIIMNSIYGYNGMEWSRYGSYLVAIATASIGRFIMTKAKEWLIAHGVDPLELDTDGIYVEGDFDLAALNAYIWGLFSQFKLRERLFLDYSEYDGMLVIKMKNYVLRYKGDNLFKGSGLRGRGVPKCAEKSMDIIVDALFEDGDLFAAWEQCKAYLAKSQLRDFEMTVNLSKSPDEYAEGSMYKKLFDQLPSVDWGDEIRFVKIKDGREPLGIREDNILRKDIDEEYYKERMKSAIERILEPILDVNDEIFTFYNTVIKRQKHCIHCDSRLLGKKHKRYLNTNVCVACEGEGRKVI